jgi:TolB-like protein/DNA-binding winged helix-turn-helix (wHTH) protein/Tfp pilus assembly protein PilF
MASATSSGGVIRFGVFELDVSAGELRKRGMRLSIQGLPVQILGILAARPGEVVTRDELRNLLWPADTFVDFDHSIRNAVGRLREALSDSAETPRYVETLPRRGYRFIGQVEGSNSALLPPEQDATIPSLPVTKRRSEHVIAAILLIGIFGSGILGYVRFLRPSTVPPIRSVAVLPLENLTGDPDQEYFADGMTDELITTLAQMSSVPVISRTSTMRFKGAHKPLPQIARELNVDAIVEGAVSRSGNQVRITAQLVDARTDRHLWARSYERDLRDVLQLQREVTSAISDEIRAKLAVRERPHPVSAKSVDPEAYEDYLRGRFSWEKGELKQSLAYFQRAIQINPNYALAYAGLAHTYISLGQPWVKEGDMRPRDVHSRAEAAARKAVEIDASLGDAHLALARVIQVYDWDWPAVEEEYRESLELNQNDALAHALFGEYLQQMGRNEDAFAEWRHAIELDPLDSGMMAGLGSAFYTARQYDSAINEFQKALQLDPDYVDTLLGLGWAYQAKKMYPEAIAELQKAVNLSNRHEVPLASLGQVLGKAGRMKEAARILDELKGRSERHYISPCLFALVQIGLGERDQAIASLEQSYTNRDQWILYLNVDPHLDDLRSDPRFKDLARRVGIPQHST